MGSDEDLLALGAEIESVLAAGLSALDQHVGDTSHRDELDGGEIARRDELHAAEIQRRDEHHAHELALIRAALQSRDIIGQAKGVIMASMSCSADEAFTLLVKQSHSENRKLVEIATEIASHPERRRRSPR